MVAGRCPVLISSRSVLRGFLTKSASESSGRAIETVGGRRRRGMLGDFGEAC